MDGMDGLLRIFPEGLRRLFRREELRWKELQEIRLRAEKPLFVVFGGRQYWMGEDGRLREGETLHHPRIVTQEEIRQTVEAASSYSLYAFEEELRQGFLTIQGGHRIGIGGRVVLDGRNIRTMKYISFLNVRLAHEVKGCADGIMPWLVSGETLFHTLFISPPRCGKTTLLRDAVRQLSGKMNVGVADERSELAACYQGIPQNDLGPRTDVLDGCPKALGMMMLIRTMSPAVIAVDEIGSREDLEAMEYALNCGCRLLATVHGTSLEEIKKKPVLGEMAEQQFFGRYVVLDSAGGPGHIRGIYDGGGKELWSCG